MQVSNQALWDSKDNRAGGICCYAEDWANLMEGEMQSGKKLEEVAERTSHEADKHGDYGMTGSSYSCAVGVLAKTWVHGERLRQWHNRQYQTADEGVRAPGVVVNPALMTITCDSQS